MPERHTATDCISFLFLTRNQSGTDDLPTTTHARLPTRTTVGLYALWNTAYYYNAFAVYNLK